MDIEITVSPDPVPVCLLRDTWRVRAMTLIAPVCDAMTRSGAYPKRLTRALVAPPD
jgi:hypothetical protein